MGTPLSRLPPLGWNPLVTDGRLLVPVHLKLRLVDLLIIHRSLQVALNHPKNTGASSPRARKLLADVEAVLQKYGVPEPLGGWQAMTPEAPE